MAEIMEREELAPGAGEAAPEAAAAPTAEKPKGGKWKNLPRKKRRRMIRWGIILVVLAVIAAIAVALVIKSLSSSKETTSASTTQSTTESTTESTHVQRGALPE